MIKYFETQRKISTFYTSGTLLLGGWVRFFTLLINNDTHIRNVHVVKIMDQINKSAAWPNGQRRRFYDDSDRRIMSSTRTLVTLLRPWIRRFTIIISAWWLRTSSKFTWEEVKTSTGKLGKWSTPKRVRIRPKYSVPSLSRDKRIKMHQSINQSINNNTKAVVTKKFMKGLKIDEISCINTFWMEEVMASSI